MLLNLEQNVSSVISDKQQYVSLDQENVLNLSPTLNNLENWILDIPLAQNFLILNYNKKNIIYWKLPHCVKSLSISAFQMGASSITSSGSVKYPGVIFDKCIYMYEHATLVRRAAY